MLGDMLILGNWKMHLTEAEAMALAQSVAQGMLALPASVSVGICPSFVHLAKIGDALEDSNILLGGQDCHAQPQGAFTGDTSAAMLKDIGCSFTLAGHSERRALHHERSEEVRRKAEAAIQAGLHAVVCVGETLEERESGGYLQRIETQIRESILANTTREALSIAYEPVWAIGTGRTATTNDIVEVHQMVKQLLSEHFPGKTPRVLYGGSVKANNALEILSLPVVDGVLVGGASLDATAFAQIMGAAAKTAQKMA